MATSRKAPKESAIRKERKRPPSVGIGSIAKYVAAIVVVVAIIGAAIFAGLLSIPSSQSNFTTFRNNFNSAPRVAITVAAYNSTILSGTIGCATAIIEEVVASKTEHRNSSTIDLNIINQSSCITTRGLGGTNSSNYTTTSLQDCLNISRTEPTIYINYSTANRTIISPEYMYVSGNMLFLRECGVASQIS